MNQNIKFLFVNFSLVTILSSIVSVGAFAQQVSIFQQASRAPKDYSNLAPPTQYSDSFLGQDKKGPYILTWKNFNYSPGNPVWISVDNQVLPSASYTLDVAKGEVTFASLIKRTQVVRVSGCLTGTTLSLFQKIQIQQWLRLLLLGWQLLV